NPHVAKTELRRWLPEHGIGYRHEKRLGGLRPEPRELLDTALRDSRLAGYGAHMRTEEFGAAVDELLGEVASAGTAVMCAETAWWRCPRKLLADFVQLARRVRVEHLGDGGSRDPHPRSDVARVREDGLLVYDGGQQELFS